jgi:hypothetical protein
MWYCVMVGCLPCWWEKSIGLSGNYVKWGTGARKLWHKNKSVVSITDFIVITWLIDEIVKGLMINTVVEVNSMRRWIINFSCDYNKKKSPYGV